MPRIRVSSLVIAIPPSALVMIFTGWKLNTVMSDQRQLPTQLSPTEAPIECDASSTTRKPKRRASCQISSWRVGKPAKCTGTTTFGKRPSVFARTSLRSRSGTLMFHVAGSISTKSTPAPQYRAQFAEATNVLGTVQSRSPGPNPSARQAT